MLIEFDMGGAAGLYMLTLAVFAVAISVPGGFGIFALVVFLFVIFVEAQIGVLLREF